MSSDKKRDYKKEWEKEKKTKVTRLIKVDKELFEKVTKTLKQHDLTINGFVNNSFEEIINSDGVQNLSKLFGHDATTFKELQQKYIQSTNQPKIIGIKEAKILFSKNKQGYTTTQITIPQPFIKKLGFTPTERNCDLILDGDKIIIKKSAR